MEDWLGGEGGGRSGSCLSTSSGDSIGDGSNCWRDINVSCDAVENRFEGRVREKLSGVSIMAVLVYGIVDSASEMFFGPE